MDTGLYELKEFALPERIQKRYDAVKYVNGAAAGDANAASTHNGSQQHNVNGHSADFLTHLPDLRSVAEVSESEVFATKTARELSYAPLAQTKRGSMGPPRLPPSPMQRSSSGGSRKGSAPHQRVNDEKEAVDAKSSVTPTASSSHTASRWRPPTPTHISAHYQLVGMGRAHSGNVTAWLRALDISKAEARRLLSMSTSRAARQPSHQHPQLQHAAHAATHNDSLLVSNPPLSDEALSAHFCLAVNRAVEAFRPVHAHTGHYADPASKQHVRAVATAVYNGNLRLKVLEELRSEAGKSLAADLNRMMQKRSSVALQNEEDELREVRDALVKQLQDDPSAPQSHASTPPAVPDALVGGPADTTQDRPADLAAMLQERSKARVAERMQREQHEQDMLRKRLADEHNHFVRRLSLHMEQQLAHSRLRRSQRSQEPLQHTLMPPPREAPLPQPTSSSVQGVHRPEAAHERGGVVAAPHYEQLPQAPLAPSVHSPTYSEAPPMPSLPEDSVLTHDIWASLSEDAEQGAEQEDQAFTLFPSFEDLPEFGVPDLRVCQSRYSKELLATRFALHPKPASLLSRLPRVLSGSSNSVEDPLRMADRTSFDYTRHGNADAVKQASDRLHAELQQDVDELAQLETDMDNVVSKAATAELDLLLVDSASESESSSSDSEDDDSAAEAGQGPPVVGDDVAQSMGSASSLLVGHVEDEEEVFPQNDDVATNSDVASDASGAMPGSDAAPSTSGVDSISLASTESARSIAVETQPTDAANSADRAPSRLSIQTNIPTAHSNAPQPPPTPPPKRREVEELLTQFTVQATANPKRAIDAILPLSTSADTVTNLDEVHGSSDTASPHLGQRLAEFNRQKALSKMERKELRRSLKTPGTVQRETAAIQRQTQHLRSLLAVNPADITMRKRLVRLFTMLNMTPPQQLAFLTKYKSRECVHRFSKALSLWEEAASSILQRELEMSGCLLFETQHTDPQRLYGSGLQLVRETQERQKMLHRLQVISDKLEAQLDVLNDRFGDVVPFGSHPDYRAKMVHDYSDMLHGIERRRLLGRTKHLLSRAEYLHMDRLLASRTSWDGIPGRPRSATAAASATPSPDFARFFGGDSSLSGLQHALRKSRTATMSARGRFVRPGSAPSRTLIPRRKVPVILSAEDDNLDRTLRMRAVRRIDSSTMVAAVGGRLETWHVAGLRNPRARDESAADSGVVLPPLDARHTEHQTAVAPGSGPDTTIAKRQAHETLVLPDIAVPNGKVWVRGSHVAVQRQAPSLPIITASYLRRLLEKRFGPAALESFFRQQSGKR